MLSVQKELNLSRVLVIPSSQTPGKPRIEKPSEEDRVEMVRLAAEDWADSLSVDEREVKRGDVSYTVDTLQELNQEYEPSALFLILGADTFRSLDSWQAPSKLVKLCNFVVTTRPGSELPLAQEDLPKCIQKVLVDLKPGVSASLKGNLSVHFVTLEDIPASATEIRKKIRSGQNVERFLPFKVHQYIKEHSLYKPMGAKVADYEEFSHQCAQVLFDKKAVYVRGYDLRHADAPSEFALICSGTSTRHTQALADSITRFVKDEYGLSPIGIEGMGEGRWVLVDYGALIVHIFYDYVRQEYHLEDLWKGAKELTLKDQSAEGRAKDLHP